MFDLMKIPDIAAVSSVFRLGKTVMDSLLFFTSQRLAITAFSHDHPTPISETRVFSNFSLPLR